MKSLRKRLIAIPVIAVGLVLVVGASANLSGSSFEGNDGNLIVNGGAGAHDWANAVNLSVGVDQPTGTSDNSFGQGAKEDDVNTTVVSGSIPNSKADLARFAVSSETIGADTFMYLAWTRENQSGTVNFDFELNAKVQPNLLTPGAKVLNRTVNDALINYSFQGGSQNVTLTRYHWTGSAWALDGPISSTCSEGAVNAATVSDTLASPATNRPAAQFGEAAINMTCAGIVPPNTCEPFSSAYVKSRSSTSFNSEIKDFIAPVTISANNCGSLTIIKHTNPADLDQVFNYTTTGAGLSNFSLNDVGAGDNASNTKTFSGLAPGSRTVTEGADPSGFQFASLNCTNSGGNSSSTAGRVATVTIAGGGATTCTYVNDQQLGAIKVKKFSIKGTALTGATFSVAGQSVVTGADGTACVDHLAFGNYTVQETAAPTGYSIDDSSVHNVTVSANEDCTAAVAPLSLQFNDTPLTDVRIVVHSQAVGGTQSTIDCDNDALDAALAENLDVSSNGEEPQTINCTIVIDP